MSMFHGNGVVRTIDLLILLLLFPLVTASIAAASGSHEEVISDGANRELQQHRLLRTIDGKVLEDTAINMSTHDPIAGVFLELYTQTGVFVASTSTDSRGRFTFSVAPGFYVLRQVTPAGFVEGSDSDGGNPSQIDAIDVSIANSTGLVFVDQLPETAIHALEKIDPAPNQLPVFGSIAGNVKEDTNDDGKGDVNLSGVTISLYTYKKGVLKDTTVTDSEGNYLFTGVLQGKYRIIQSNLPGFVDVWDSKGIRTDSTAIIVLKTGSNRKNLNFVDKRFLPTTVPTSLPTRGPTIAPSGKPTISPTRSPTAVPTTLAPTGRPTTSPTTLAPTILSTSRPTLWPLLGSIAGNVKEDTDDDGKGDVNLSGVTISLYTFENRVLNDTTLTDSEGNYLFTGVVQGQYRIVQSNLPGFVDVWDSRGNRTDNTADIMLQRGRNMKNLNFVDKRLLPNPSPSPTTVQPTTRISNLPTIDPATTLALTAAPVADKAPPPPPLITFMPSILIPAPTISPTTLAPTVINATLAPTGITTALAPTSNPTTLAPTGITTTLSPAGSPTTLAPTAAPIPMAPPQPLLTDHPTTLIPTSLPTRPTPVDCNCRIPKTVPSECEVKEFIKILDVAVGSEHKVAAQWLRLSFHDAGTFNQVTGEGGANGCLMYHPDMRNEPENGHLEIAINTLETLRDNWELLNSTCIDISCADVTQFAGLFAAVRQTNTPGLTDDKIAQLLKFEWGRRDEPNCQVGWCRNLPGFILGTEDVLSSRCRMAGKEIKNKMMDRNGFTSEEATALIGAHTIGLTRNKFGPKHAAPWVEEGADDFTPEGPVFNNAFFGFLETRITANSTTDFDLNPAPFNVLFHTWVQTAPPNGTKLSYIDTDLVLAFPPRNASDHPDYHVHTAAFSNNNTLFLTTFYEALTKMGKLGVKEKLLVPSPCTICKDDAESLTTTVVNKVQDDVSDAVSAALETIAVSQEEQKEAIINQTTVTQLFILTDNSTNSVRVNSTNPDFLTDNSTNAVTVSLPPSTQ